MGRIGAGDLGRIARFVAAARAGEPGRPVSRPTIVALRDLVGADDAEYFELRRADRAMIAHVQVREIDIDSASAEEALRRYGAQNPLNWRRWRPEDGPMRLSNRIGGRELERLEFYHHFLRPNGLTDNLKIWLHADRASAACIQLWRVGGTFTKRDEDVLGVLQQHLIGLRSSALAGGAALEGREPALTRREAEIVSWAVRGESDVAIAGRLGISAATVGKHLENAFAALGVRSRTEALWRLIAARGAGTEPDGPDLGRGGSLDAR